MARPTAPALTFEAPERPAPPVVTWTLRAHCSTHDRLATPADCRAALVTGSDLERAIQDDAPELDACRRETAAAAWLVQWSGYYSRKLSVTPAGEWHSHGTADETRAAPSALTLATMLGWDPDASRPATAPAAPAEPSPAVRASAERLLEELATLGGALKFTGCGVSLGELQDIARAVAKAPPAPEPRPAPAAGVVLVRWAEGSPRRALRIEQGRWRAYVGGAGVASARSPGDLAAALRAVGEL